jgi:ribosome recycling factor
MATVELTVEQLRDAILQLPGEKRRQLLKQIERLPSADEARAAVRQVRGNFRLNAKQRKRMAELLAKGNDGALTLNESRELDELVDQFERKTLEMAQAPARSRPTS